MRDFKNIDRLFQENLKDFEVFPPKRSWNAIEKQLNDEPKKRHFPFWTRISSIAAMFILFFGVGTIYFIPENNFTKNFRPKRNNSQKTLEIKDTLEKVTLSSKELKSSENKTFDSKVIQLNPEENLTVVADNEEITAEVSSKENTISSPSLNKFALTDTKNLPFTKRNKVRNEITESKFTVATIFAPIYFSSFGDGSGADAQFNSNHTSGNTSYSYGVKLAYKLNNKFSLQSGLNMINLGQTTNNVYVTPGVAVVSFSNISNLPNIAKGSADLSKQGTDLTNQNSASLNQVFGYVEIPVEIKYNVTEGKIGLNIVGGFSTLLLNRDEVFVESTSFSQSLGTSNNLRPINFSGNFGVDIDYSLRKNLFINISPMLKVQTNTFSKTSGDIQTYYLGVYTGLNYKF